MAVLKTNNQKTIDNANVVIKGMEEDRDETVNRWNEAENRYLDCSLHQK